MKVTNFIVKLGVLVLPLLASVVFAADPVGITGVEVSNLSADKQVVKVSFTGDAPAPASFLINNPPRIAFDFPNITNQTGKNSVQVNGNVLRMISIAEGTGRTRLVLSLQKMAAYDAKVEGKDVLITIDGAAAAATAEKAVQFSEPKAGDVVQGIQAVDFRRGVNGEGKIIVDLSSANVGIDIRQQGKSLAVDFSKATLPKKLERRMDVIDFGTPVQKIDFFGQGDSAKMLIEPKGKWEYSAYQTESRFTIEIREAVEEKDIQAKEKTYKGEKLSLNFQSVEVRTVLQVIAEFTGMNIITSDTVNGSLTLRLKDVPWDQALEIILQSKGLDQRKVGNVVWIAPRDELAAKEKQALENNKQIRELEPTRTEFFSFKYAKAEAWKAMLENAKTAILSSRGSWVIDPRTNMLMITDIPAKLEEVRQLIAKTDVPMRQVMIEARIVEASDGFSSELGAKLNLSYGSQGATSATIGNSVRTGSAGANLPAPGVNGFSPASIALAAASSHGLINLELSALEGEGKGKIISSPRLITSDQIEAIIEDGQEIPYSQTAPNGATTVSFKKATLSLRVTPQITPDGHVMMNLKVNKDSRGAETTAGPAIDTKQIVTQVLAENGGTVVIGGIFTQTTKDTVTKVPFLGDIPILGYLFKETSKVDEKRELLIFITPRVISEDLSLNK